ncbi:hypothetical protein EDM02_03675 [Candidatus Cardinium hertigii]|uniref:Uncharacterized protein n=2 Tax=Candidatus Cardinium hertigii TaxID=247481 RepID=A0A3N2QC35_9BACT|nr:hypothetical protein EDM02_03675 [Candidatus Cardinium hertigii]
MYLINKNIKIIVMMFVHSIYKKGCRRRSTVNWYMYPAIWYSCFITYSCTNLKNGMKHTQDANGQNISTQETVVRASQSDCICKNASPLAAFNSDKLHMAAYAGCMDCIEKIPKDSPDIIKHDKVRNSTLLHTATRYGRTYVAEVLLDKGANIEAIDKDGYTALHLAAIYGKYDIAKLLLESQANKNSYDKLWHTALHWAVKHGHCDIAELLLSYNASIHYRNQGERDTVLHWAVKYNQENIAQNIVQLLLNKLIEINQIEQINIQNKDGNTVLHLAVEYGMKNLVGLLLDSGAKINIRNKDGNTALHLVVKYNQENIAQNIVQLLLNKLIQINQIDQINIQNNDGNTALHLAAIHGIENLTELLLDNGAKINIRNKDGNTALHLAVKYNQENIAQLLLNKLIQINQIDQINIQNNDGNTALHLAAIDGRENLVELLLDNGAKIDMQNKKQMMPLEYAVKHRHANMVKLLLDRGNKINKQNKWGIAALHWASKQSDLDGIELLLNAGVKVDAQNDDGNTALHIAYRQCCRFIGSYHKFTRSRQLNTVKLLERCSARKDIENKQGYSPEDYAYLVFIRNCYGINLLNSRDGSHIVEKRILGYLLQNNKFKQRNTPTNQNSESLHSHLPNEIWDICKFITTDLYLNATGQVTQSGTQLPQLRDYVEKINPDQAMEYERVASGLLNSARELRDLCSKSSCVVM